MVISKKHMDRLDEIKFNIEQSSQYFKDNNARYNYFLNFVFNTSLTSQDKTKLNTLQKPTIEFNILEALVSRLRGEFAKQEPGVVVRAADGVPVERLTPEFLQTMDVIEAHIREIFFDASNDSLEYKVYSDILAGGFTVVEVYTDYVNDMSFEQCIKVDRVFDPTLTGFDPLARQSHKGDGRYCFQLVPKTKTEFEEEFGEHALKDIDFTRNVGAPFDGSIEFNWYYKNQDQEIVMVADYYEKKHKKVKIYKLSNGHVIEKKDYERLLAVWEMKGFIEQPPIPVEERWTVIEGIERYRLCGSKILEHTMTDYKYLPLVFIDGNSVVLRNDESGASVQMTRPYVYHAKGIQQLKNFSGQTIAAEIENMVQHKFKVALEAIPEDYLDAYQNVQQASVLVYHAFYKDNPEQPLPPPMEIQRTPTPPIVEATFMGSDQVTQTILGSYDGVLGIHGQQISGAAIQQGAMQSNAAAIPYLMGYIKGLNRIAQIIIDMIPKYYVTPRSLPIRGVDGKRSYQIVNDDRMQNGIYLNYDPNDLQVRVEAGVSSAVQKQVALDQIIRMMQASQLFAQFINTEGLETIIDNMDIRGVDELKAKALQFMQQQQQMAQEAAERGDPMAQLAQQQIETEKEIEMMRISAQREKAEGELATAAARVAIEKQKADMQYLQVMAEIRDQNQKSAREAQRMAMDDSKEAVELALKLSEQHGMQRE